MRRKAVAKPRVTVPPRRSLGLAIRAFRLREGLLQADLGAALGLSGRVISDIERGLRALTENEVEAFQKRFKIRLKDIDTSSLQEKTYDIRGPRLYDHQEFFQLQQDFLYERKLPDSNLWFGYDLWILNPQSLPMLDSNEVTSTWAENLSAGATYNTIWLFCFSTPEDVQRFMVRARTVLDKTGPGAGRGKIRVYPVDVGLSLSHEADAVREYYADLLKDSVEQPHPTRCLELHPVLSIEKLPQNQQLVELLVGFYFATASVVGYKPRRQIHAAPWVALALRDAGILGQPGSNTRYCILGDQSTKRFMQLVRYLEEGLNRTKGGKA